MKKRLVIITSGIMALVLIGFIFFKGVSSADSQTGNLTITTNNQNQSAEVKPYKFPEFYRGIYLTYNSGREMDKLKSFVERSKAAHINTLVIDVQKKNTSTCAIPKENVEYCIANGIHPVARIVVFPDGLKEYPVPDAYVKDKINYAVSCAQNGFHEIQLDYIRFNDYGKLKHLTYQQKYDYIQDLIGKIRSAVKDYDVKIAADVFGRIPLNNNDEIGQKMEVLDQVVDNICPMAYPSHYTWSPKLIANPYHTVFITSKRGRERLKKAEIVTYIQAFKIKIDPSQLTYDQYLEEQIKAVHDAKVRGYIFWNASQDYATPFTVTKNFYEKIYKDDLNVIYGSIKPPFVSETKSSEKKPSTKTNNSNKNL